MYEARNSVLATIGRTPGRLEGGTREPVIALHGSGANGGQWRRLGEALGPRYELFAPSFYGCGLAGHWPGERAFSLAAEADPIVAIVDRLDGPVHLVGHSYGGGVALEVAHARPDAVTSPRSTSRRASTCCGNSATGPRPSLARSRRSPARSARGW